jgi:hypothetical protein
VIPQRTLLAILACTAGLSLFGCSKGDVLARAEKMGGRGFPYTVTAKKLSERYRVELLFDHRLPVSSYEFYAGSDPATTANITWSQLGDFSVYFGNGLSVHCSWDEQKAVWEQK